MGACCRSSSKDPRPSIGEQVPAWRPTSWAKSVPEELPTEIPKLRSECCGAFVHKRRHFCARCASPDCKVIKWDAYPSTVKAACGHCGCPCTVSGHGFLHFDDSAPPSLDDGGSEHLAHELKVTIDVASTVCPLATSTVPSVLDKLPVSGSSSRGGNLQAFCDASLEVDCIVEPQKCHGPKISRIPIELSQRTTSIDKRSRSAHQTRFEQFSAGDLAEIRAVRPANWALGTPEALPACSPTYPTDCCAAVVHKRHSCSPCGAESCGVINFVVYDVEVIAACGHCGHPCNVIGAVASPRKQETSVDGAEAGSVRKGSSTFLASEARDSLPILADVERANECEDGEAHLHVRPSDPGAERACTVPSFASKPVVQEVAPKHSDAISLLMESTFKRIRTRDRKGRLPKALKVINVQRIVNNDLWVQYEEERRRLHQKRKRRCTAISAISGGELMTSCCTPFLDSNLDETLNEVHLLHGSSRQALCGITEEGFKLKDSISNLYGNGFYFAECCAKADEYARDLNSDGIFGLVMCRVLLGEVLQMTAGGPAAEKMIEAALDSGLYDSVLGNREACSSTYKEFVIYDARRAYPEYFIEYLRVL